MDDPSPNRGAAALRLWLVATERDAPDVAAILDISPAAVRHWLRGVRLPTRVPRERLSRLTRGEVPPEAWDRSDVADLDAARAAHADVRA